MDYIANHDFLGKYRHQVIFIKHGLRGEILGISRMDKTCCIQADISSVTEESVIA